MTGWPLSGQGGVASFWNGKLSQKIGKKYFCAFFFATLTLVGAYITLEIASDVQPYGMEGPLE